MAETKRQVIDIVNEKIIEKLEKGVNPWKKHWKTSGGVLLNTPRNYFTNAPYRGLNIALLDSGYYLSYKQLQELGGKIKKGANPHLVVYSKPVQYASTVENEETGEDEEILKEGWMLRYYWVYALEDCEGYRPIKNRKKAQEVEYNEVELEDAFEEVIYNYTKRDGVQFEKLEQDQAYYMPSAHRVVVPLPKQFTNATQYYQTAFHELGHSTSKHLKRELGSRFGTEKYAKEELVAEICSIYCLNALGVDDEHCFDNDIAYLQSWAKHIKGESKYFIYSAMSKAQKAFEYIFNVTKESE